MRETIESLLQQFTEKEREFLATLKVSQWALWMILRWAKLRGVLAHRWDGADWRKPEPRELTSLRALNDLIYEIDRFKVHLDTTIPLDREGKKSERMSTDMDVRAYLYHLQVSKEIKEIQRDRLVNARYRLASAYHDAEEDVKAWSHIDHPEDPLMVDLWECGPLEHVWKSLVELQLIINPDEVEADQLSTRDEEMPDRLSLRFSL